MSDSDSNFDPYRKWLGIRDPKRPPCYYRLLGLDAYEDDREIISMAADRQMEYIRTFQLGPHGEISQQLLNELAEARRCLLSPDQKQEYDLSLEIPVAATPIATPAELPIPEVQIHVKESSAVESVSVVNTFRPAERSSYSNQRKNTGGGILVQFAAIISGGLAAVVVAYWLIQSGIIKTAMIEKPDPTPIEAPDKPIDAPAKPPKKPLATKSKPNPTTSIKQPVMNSKVEHPKSIPGSEIAKETAAGKKTLPWDEARWPKLPNKLISPASELDRLLQKTRIAIARRDFPTALVEYEKVKNEVGFLNSKADLRPQISELMNFWNEIEILGKKLKVGDQLVFRDTPIVIDRVLPKSIIVKMTDGRRLEKGFSTVVKKIDRDLVMAIVKKHRPDTAPKARRLLALDFIHEETRLAITAKPLGFAGIDPNVKIRNQPSVEPDASPIPVEPEKQTVAPKPKLAEPPKSTDVVKARRRIKDLYSDGYGKSTAASTKRSIVQQMIDAARVEKDPVLRYTLLSESISIAESCGEPKLGMRALESLANSFNVDFWELAKSFLSGVVKKTTTPRQHEQVLDVLKNISIRSLREKRYEDAFLFANKVAVSAEKIGDLTIYNDALLLKNQTKEISNLFARAERARKVIKNQPENSKANEDLGNFYCLVENDIDQGLKYWANSGKAKLVQISKLETTIDENKRDRKELILADAWFQMGEAKKTYFDARCLARARIWYDAARLKSNGMDI